MISSLCLIVYLNGLKIGCTTDKIRYLPVEREIRYGAVRIGKRDGAYPRLEYFPVERQVRIVGNEIGPLKDGFE